MIFSAHVYLAVAKIALNYIPQQIFKLLHLQYVASFVLLLFSVPSGTATPVIVDTYAAIGMCECVTCITQFNLEKSK